MRFTTALLIASAGYASAQLSSSTVATSTTSAASSSSSSDCEAQYILDQCIDIEMPKVEACGGNDFVCLCENWNNVLTCYNNCPDSPNRNSALSSKTSYCQAAGPAMSSSSAALASRTATAAASSAAGATATSTGSSSGSSSDSSASAAASSDAAAPVALPAGGIFALLLGLAGML